MRFFNRQNVSRMRNPPITNMEEGVLLVKVTPLSQEHPPTPQPTLPTPQKGGCWGAIIRHLWKKRKGRYDGTSPLISDKEENVVLLRVTPITEDRPPEGTTPPRGGGRGEEEDAAHRLQPLPQPQPTTDDAIGENYNRGNSRVDLSF